MRVMRSVSKYGAKKVVTEDGVFDSKKEYSIWCDLKLLERAGEIRELERQVPYTLIPSQYEKISETTKLGKAKEKNRLVERECKYVADFVYILNATNEQIVLDVKGVRTPEYIIKRKLMLYIHNIKIKEI